MVAGALGHDDRRQHAGLVGPDNHWNKWKSPAHHDRNAPNQLGECGFVIVRNAAVGLPAAGLEHARHLYCDTEFNQRFLRDGELQRERAPFQHGSFRAVTGVRRRRYVSDRSRVWRNRAVRTVKDYVYAGGRLLAIAESAQEGVDFEQFTGANDRSVPLPPLTVGEVTFSGGQVYPTVSFLPAGDPPLYGTYDPVLSPDGRSCWGCQGTITVDFAQPVSNVSFLLLNGGRSTDFTVQDDKGDFEVVTLPGNLESGTAMIALPSSGIRQITITSALGSSEWDFWIDNFRFTVDGAGGSGMMLSGGRRVVTTVHGTPAKPSRSGPAATAGGDKSP